MNHIPKTFSFSFTDHRFVLEPCRPASVQSARYLSVSTYVVDRYLPHAGSHSRYRVCQHGTSYMLARRKSYRPFVAYAATSCASSSVSGRGPFWSPCRMRGRCTVARRRWNCNCVRLSGYARLWYFRSHSSKRASSRKGKRAPSRRNAHGRLALCAFVLFARGRGRLLTSAGGR